jgi:hypothetical protein
VKNLCQRYQLGNQQYKKTTSQDAIYYFACSTLPISV